MEKRIFFVTLAAAFIFLGVMASVQVPTFFATGNVTLELQANATEVRVFLNGTEGDITLGPGSYVNITAIINVSGEIVYLDVNMTGWDTQNNVTRIENMTYFADAGVYNITAWYPGAVNYTPSSVTYFLTISAPSAPPTPPSPGPGGATGPPINVTPPAPISEFRVDEIDEDKAEIIGINLGPGNYYADLSNSTQIPITAAAFTLRDSVDYFKIIIENVSKPSEIPGIEEQYGLEFPYQYIKVTAIGTDPQGPFRAISMNFKVEKGWILANRIDEGTVALYRYENGWRPLSVVKWGEDENYGRFSAGDVTAFSSYFVISAKQLIILPPLLVPSYVMAPMTYMQLALLLFVILVLILIILAKRRRKKELVIVKKR